MLVGVVKREGSTNHDPLNSLLLVVSCHSGHSVPFTSRIVLDLVGFTVGLVNSSNQHVVGDIINMATILQLFHGLADYTFVVIGYLTQGPAMEIWSVVVLP